MKIVPISYGGDSKSFRISAEGKQLILRVGGRRENYDVEHVVLNMIRKKKGLVPKGISASPDYSLQEIIDGVSLDKVPQRQWTSIIHGVGKQLEIVHNIKISGFGQIDVNTYREDRLLRGSNQSWLEFLQSIFSYRFDEFKSKVEKEQSEGFIGSKLPLSRQKQLVEVVQREKEIKSKLNKLPEINQGSLLHGDLHFEHILVRKNKLSGLIDFNKTLTGDPLYDIAYFSIMPHGELYPELLETTKHINFDSKAFSLYRLLISVGKLYTRYVRLDYLHDYPEVLDHLFAELSK